MKEIDSSDYVKFHYAAMKEKEFDAVEMIYLLVGELFETDVRAFLKELDQFHIKRFEDYVKENKDFANMIIKYIADNYVCFYDADYKLGKIDQEKVHAYFEQHVNDVEYFRNGKLDYELLGGGCGEDLGMILNERFIVLPEVYMLAKKFIGGDHV